MTDIPDRYSEDLDQYVEQVERDGLLSAPPWLKREILEAAGITADKEGSAAMASREERRRSFRQYTAEVIFAMAASLVLLFLPSGITGTGRPENRDTAFSRRKGCTESQVRVRSTLPAMASYSAGFTQVTMSKPRA